MRTMAGLLGVYGLGVVAARVAFPRVLFPVPRAAGACPEDARVFLLRAKDGAEVRAFEVSAAEPRGTLVYFHGNGQTAADAVPLARMLADAGLRVLVLEYRGYGVSRHVGRPHEAGLLADAAALLEHLDAPVALWGTSLGAAVAVAMARRYPTTRLVLVAPFTSARDACRHHAPFLPASFVVRDVFDSAAIAAAVHVPTLVIHGERDRLVPARMGRELAAKIPGARFVPIAGAGHGIFWTHGDDVVREALAHLKSEADAACSG